MKSICRSCNRVFSSVSSFDMHRVGRHEPMERRCLSEDEMLDKGMALNERGHWTSGGTFDASRFANKNDVA